jgi:hypothetical protein
MGLNLRTVFGAAALAFALAGSEAAAQDWDGSFATDFDLEMIAYAAYNGAREYALTHDNYFMWSASEFPALRESIIEGLKAEGYEAATIKRTPTTSVSAATACGTEGQTDLRVKLTSDGGGILLVAVGPERMAAYEYDPDKSPDIVITYPKECGGDLAQAGDPDQITAPIEEEPVPEKEPEDGGEDDIVDITPNDDDQPSDDGAGKTKDKG